MTASVDLAVRLGVDPKKANEMVRGVVSLPNGTGKDMKVLALVSPDKEDEAKNAGADYVGLDEYIEKIKGGWTDVDVIVTMPSVMGKLGPLGRILGPRGLMPNPKLELLPWILQRQFLMLKLERLTLRLIKQVLFMLQSGKVSFSPDKIAGNASELIQTLIKLKPSLGLRELILKAFYFINYES